MGWWSDYQWGKRCELARNLLKETLGIDTSERSWGDVMWYSDGKPFVFIVYKYIGAKLVRREFYEFRDKKLEYVGYMDRKKCLNFYWRIKGEESFRDWGKNVRNDKNEEQVDNCVQRELKEYFLYYKKFVVREPVPLDGAYIKRDIFDENGCYI